MSTVQGRRSRLDRWVPASLLAIVGLGVGALALEFLLTHRDPPVWWEVELLATVGVSAGVAYSAYWLARSEYGVGDLWGVLGWSLAGVVGAAALVGVVYVHQTVESASIAEPAFLLEFLALIGAAAGVAVGVDRRSRSGRSGRPVAEAEGGDAGDPLDCEEANDLLVPLMDRSPETLRQRRRIVESLVETRTRRIPIRAFAVQLSRTEPFPDDDEEVATLLSEEHLPVMTENGLLEVDAEVETVEYVGPEELAEALSDGCGP
ncbi:MAG: hypothetical protein V5A46_03490 [Haloferacaceae archaeon]